MLALAVLCGTVAACWTARQLESARPGSRLRIAVSIPRGSSVKQIAAILADRGVVRSAFSIRLAAMLSGDSSRLRDGQYVLSPAESPALILKDLEGGKSPTGLVIVPEGFTLVQIAERLQEQGVTDGDDFLDVATTQGRTFRCRDGFVPPNDDLEGYLFPDSYQFDLGEPTRSVIQTMLDRFDAAVVASHPNVRDWRTPIVVGSMVEREAKLECDRPLVAAVIYNRLKVGMRLQIDATVEYALLRHKGRLMYSDLRTASPYNTYLHKGLPPGAICNPGLPSIEAALNPANVDYLYYVQGPGEVHLFSRTLSEQDRNIAAVRGGRAPK
jgi:UPF0755 protein